MGVSRSAFSATGLAQNVLVSGLLLQAFSALAYFFVRELGAFYAVAALFGFVYAGVMPLYAVLARENFPLRMMGTIIGGTAMAGSLGMATGPLVGGLIYDTFGSYGWLYIGAWGMGIGAFLIALTFRPYAAEADAQGPAHAAVSKCNNREEMDFIAYAVHEAALNVENY